MPTRRRMQLTLVLLLVIALCVFVPSFLYFTELALRELRFAWWLILILGVIIWILVKLERKK